MKLTDPASIRLIAVDLDGTLLTRQKTITPRTLKAINACRERGMALAFVTGRSETAARPFLEQLCPDGAGLAYGAQVMVKGQTIATRHMQPEAAAHVLAGVKHSPRVRYQTRDERRYETAQMPGCYPVDWDTPPTQEVEHIAVWELPAARAQALAREAGCILTQVCGDRWCNFSAPGTGKGPAMRRIMDALGIKTGEAVAFGDESCDVEFFEVCGTGVAMGNGDAYTLAHADYKTESNDCDGIAVFLEQHVLT